MIVGIAAVARNGVIGDGQDIPWRMQDWRRFRELTSGQVLIMGRKTDSIGRPLPGRTTFVVTRDKTWRRDAVRAVPCLDEALALAGDLAPGTIFVAGGGEIYRAAWHRLEALEITEVDLEPVGKVTFPPIEPQEWRDRERTDGFSFVSYRRVLSPEWLSGVGGWPAQDAEGDP